MQSTVRTFLRHLARLLVLSLLWTAGPLQAAETFRVATFNLNNYVDDPGAARPLKTEASKAKIRESIRALRAEVIALQEMGSSQSLAELTQSLKAEGMDYPHSEILFGSDTNIHLAVLSKFPITACHRLTNDTYLLMGRRMRVQRGFLEVQFQVNPDYTFTAFIAHLKSRRQAAVADEAEMRLQEALLLREKIDALLRTQPKANFLVMGDMNDVKDSPPIRTLLGRYKNALLDTRPAEPNGDSQPSSNSRWDPPRITWTHYYAKEDTYSRFDYILASPGMAREWMPHETFVSTVPNWGLASDHRPIVAGFVAEDK